MNTEKNSTDFQKAVQLAKGLIGSSTKGRNLRNELNEIMGAKLLKHDPELLLRNAATNFDYFEGLKRGVAHALERSDVVPPSVQDWLVKYLRSEFDPPAKSVGAEKATQLHVAIYTAITFLLLEGMKATRADHGSATTSACDAVAEAMKDLGLKPATFSGVKRVWFDMQNYFDSNIAAN